MRILMIPDFYPPVVGGIERHVEQLSKELVARGHRVAVAAIAGGGSAAGVEDDGGVEVHRLRTTLGRLPMAHLESGRPFAPPAPDPELTAGIARIVRDLRPDVVHGHAWSVHSYLPVHAVAGIPLVVTLHEYGLVCAKKSLVYRGASCSGPGLAKCLGCASAHYGPVRGIPMVGATFVGGRILRRAASMFIAVSSYVASASRLQGRPHRVIPNFIPDAEPAVPSTAERAADGLPPGPFLLFVGALGGHKGIHVLLDAYRRLGGAPPLVAMGHRWHDTPSEIPDGVTILEDRTRDEVRRAWATCSFGLIPSTWPEPFGIVALEAMEAGRAVVASRIGGLADIVRDGETGLMVPAGDVPSLAAAMERLIDDPDLRGRLGAGARAGLERFRAGAVVPRIEAAYREVVEARVTRGGRRLAGSP